MNNQLKLDFTKPIEHKENNAHSQALFEKNKGRLRGQCKTIYEALKRGERLTVKSAMINYGIGDFKRRIKDLKDNYKVKGIKDRLLEGRYKEWWLEEDVQ